MWLTLGTRVHERQVQEVLERGNQLFMLVADPARRNGELLTAPIAKPTRTSVSFPQQHTVRIIGVLAGGARVSTSAVVSAMIQAVFLSFGPPCQIVLHCRC